MSNHPVTSRPYPAPQTPRRAGIDLAGFIGKVAAWAVALSVGPVIWAINGGYSVIGLGVVAAAFNDAGQLFWAMMTRWRFTVPAQVPGLDNTQPVLPWVLVGASSLLQIVVTWLTLQRRAIPPWMVLLAIALSVYDLATTFFGFGTVQWIQRAGWVVQGPLAVIFTFSLEVLVGFLLRRK